MEKLKAIVIDFDGTLVDSADVKTRAFGELYQPYGAEIVEKVVAYHRLKQGVSRFEKFRFWQESLLGEVYTSEKGEELSQIFSKLVLDRVVISPYMLGVETFLEENYKRRSLFVASATPEAELQEIISRRGMEGYFQ